ncbi:MAG: leucine-rich repeat domain-containing protein, partial [Clostridia bacterium]|nr:leucine-rich repeat domain-containing protein [Clostridia bacterium]
VINSVDDYLYHYDPNYQDYLQGNIRLERYRNKHLIPGSVQKKYPNEKYKVTLSPGRSEIQRGEFYGREDMSTVVIPEGVTKISDGAFFNCKNLVSVVIPESVKIIEHNAFLNCKSLREVCICNLRKWCEIDFGIFSNPLNYAEKLYVNGKLLTEFVVPEGTEKINPFIFEGYKSLTKLKITNEVKRIEGYAFAKCTGLTELVFPNSIEYIGNAAFDGCENLEKITFPNHRITIFEGAFESCPKLSDEIKSVINQNTQKRDLGDYELVMLDDGYERWVHK